MYHVRLFRVGLTLSSLTLVASLVCAANVAAQEKRTGARAPNAPVTSFECGVCDAGYTPLSGANWILCWRQAAEQGLVIQHACFQRQPVLFEASQPFVIVPYHNRAAQFKDGLSAKCGGVPYVQITPTVAVVGADDDNPGYPASSGFPAQAGYSKLELAATYDTFNYRYRQRWIFHGTGDIDAMFGFGGFLLPDLYNVSHVHSPYWRLDFDLDDYTQNYIEEFSHPDVMTPDSRTPVILDGPHAGVPNNFYKWTVRSDTPNAQGKLHSWDIEPITNQLTENTTADFWGLAYNFPQEAGAEVGTFDCTDYEISNVYTKGNNISPTDIVVWATASGHHEPRDTGEEGGGQLANRKQMPGHDWVGIHISPRNFTNTTPNP